MSSAGEDTSSARSSRSSYVSPYSSSGSPARPSTTARAKPTSLPPLPSRRSAQSDGADGANGGAAGEATDETGAAKVSRRSNAMGVSSAPQFYLGGGNGVKLLQGLLEARGWQRIPPGPAGRASSHFKLKWCERSSDFDFVGFRDGRQMIGRNPKIGCIGNKLRLRQTLTE